MDLWKMSNPFWDIIYKKGMMNASSMIFLISDEWLKSQFAWQEFDWFKEMKSEYNTDLKGVFVLFDMSLSMDEVYGGRELGEVVGVANHWGCEVINTSSETCDDLRNVEMKKSNGEAYPIRPTYKYSLSRKNAEQIVNTAVRRR
nr:hypothetical protein [Vibrio vulnificus]